MSSLTLHGWLPSSDSSRVLNLYMLGTTNISCPTSKGIGSHRQIFLIFKRGIIGLYAFNWSFEKYKFIGYYGDIIMSTMASQITSLTIAYSTFYSGADQRKHQSSASLAFVRGIHWGPVNSPHKGPVKRKMIPFMTSSWVFIQSPRKTILFCCVFLCYTKYIFLPYSIDILVTLSNQPLMLLT